MIDDVEKERGEEDHPGAVRITANKMAGKL